MARKYKRLCYEDRQTIEKMLKAGEKVVTIAGELGVHRDTIYKELNRSAKPYRAEAAQNSL